MTVRKNIAFGLGVRKVPAEDDARARSTSCCRWCSSTAWASATRRSSRAASASASRSRARWPSSRKLLLLDEPFGALDAQVRVELRDWLRRFHDERHVTTLLVTHDQEEAMEVSDHVVVMHEGRVAQAGHAARDLRSPGDAVRGRRSSAAPTCCAARCVDGRVSVGALAVVGVAGDGTDAPDGAAVNAYVRPHDVTLTKADDGAPEVAVARVERHGLAGRLREARRSSCPTARP